MTRIRLLPVDPVREHIQILYDLLAERTPEQSISHKTMPTLEEHATFVQSQPYAAWYLIEADEGCVGGVYLSRQREIGVSVFRAYQRRGYGEAAVRELMWLWPGKFLANVNPSNEASKRLWEKLGFGLLQWTYGLPASVTRCFDATA
jgi:RimJ/RimL family protein N-acetyltransferase